MPEGGEPQITEMPRNYRNAPELPKCLSKLTKCPMEKRNGLELGVLYYYKHFLKIL
jgi:hypothetical protein